MAVLAVACHREKSPPDGAPPVIASPRAGPGIRIPLPEGWQIRLGSDQSLLAGPNARTVLRVDVRPGLARQLPSPQQMGRAFADEMMGRRVIVEETRVEPSFSSVRLRLDQHPGATQVLLAARRVGEDLFLCASQPGATSAELIQAETACQGLTAGNPPQSRKPNEKH